jgi:hypothetical protein
MIIAQTSSINELQDNNFCFNSFPLEKQTNFSKEILISKESQETSNFFQLDTTLNPYLSPKIDLSINGSTNKIVFGQIKNESSDFSFALDEMSQDGDTKILSLNNNVVFKTEINNNEINVKKGLEDKLLMNRISARKSRLKKKQYIKCLEEETARLKNEILLKKNVEIVPDKINSDLSKEDKEKNDKFFNKFILFEKQEKEIKLKGQKKQAGIMKQYENLQKSLLREMLVKQIHCFIPLRIRIFGDKFIKLIEINEDDEISVIINKINENIDKIKNYLEVVPKKRIQSVIKLHEIYKKIKIFVDNYQQLFSESFKY